DLVDALGRDLRDLVDQVRARRAGERSDGHLVELLVESLRPRGVAMAEAVHADPADQVDISVAVDVLDHRALRAFDGDAGAEREALQAGGKMPLLVLDQAAGSRARDFGLDVRGFERHFPRLQKPQQSVRFPDPLRRWAGTSS